MKEVLAALTEALAIEREGEKFYRQAAEGCEEEVTRQTFLALAEQEQAHATYFQVYYDEVAKQKAWPEAAVVELESQDLPAQAQAIFEQAMPELGQAGPMLCACTHDLYETAMDKERMSIALYGKQAEEAESDEQQAFFEFLVAQEKGHLNLLYNTQKYLDDPANFFFDEEQWIVEG